MIIINEGCLFCIHFRGYKNRVPKCDAFANGIPSEIRRALFDHRKPHPEDNGLQFELNPKYEEHRQIVEDTFKYIEENIQTQLEIKQEQDARLQKEFEQSDHDDFEVFLDDLDKKFRERAKKTRERLSRRKKRINKEELKRNLKIWENEFLE